jgi:hypothetical protein
MSSSDQETIYSGTLQFNEQTHSCYILMNDGRTIPTSPLFDFFNSFISLETLIQRLPNHYTEEDVEYISDQIRDWSYNYLTNTELVNLLKEKYRF